MPSKLSPRPPSPPLDVSESDRAHRRSNEQRDIPTECPSGKEQRLIEIFRIHGLPVTVSTSACNLTEGDPLSNHFPNAPKLSKMNPENKATSHEVGTGGNHRDPLLGHLSCSKGHLPCAERHMDGQVGRWKA